MLPPPTAVSEHNVHFIFMYTRHQGRGVRGEGLTWLLA